VTIHLGAALFILSMFNLYAAFLVRFFRGPRSLWGRTLSLLVASGLVLIVAIANFVVPSRSPVPDFILVLGLVLGAVVFINAAKQVEVDLEQRRAKGRIDEARAERRRWRGLLRARVARGE
jgi:hypothetical protein